MLSTILIANLGYNYFKGKWFTWTPVNRPQKRFFNT
jgi:hypothetical protein